jgi:hypothetical protein
MLTARCAGINPIKVPRVTIMTRAPRTKEIGTVGLVYGKSVRSTVAEFIPERTNAPSTIPKTPAIKVKKTDSKII